MKNSSKNTAANRLFIIIFAAIAILGFVSILSPSPSAAPDAGPAPLPTGSTYSGYLLKVIAVTLFMVIALVVGLRVYRKQIQLRGKNTLKINSLGRYYINDKQYLLKVNVEDRNLLLGVSESSINFITEMDQDMDDEAEEPDSFGRILDLETNKETKL